jgi:hypothetical protein
MNQLDLKMCQKQIKKPINQRSTSELLLFYFCFIFIGEEIDMFGCIFDIIIVTLSIIISPWILLFLLLSKDYDDPSTVINIGWCIGVIIFALLFSPWWLLLLLLDIVSLSKE